MDQPLLYQKYLNKICFHLLWRVPPRIIPRILEEEWEHLQEMLANNCSPQTPIQATYRLLANMKPYQRTGFSRGILPRLVLTGAVLYLWWRLYIILSYTPTFSGLTPVSIAVLPVFLFALWGIWNDYLGGVFSLFHPRFFIKKHSLILCHFLVALIPIVYGLIIAYLILTSMLHLLPIPNWLISEERNSFYAWMQFGQFLCFALLLVLLVYALFKVFFVSTQFLPLVFHIVGGIHSITLILWAWKWTWRQTPSEVDAVLLMGVPYLFGVLLAISCGIIIAHKNAKSI